MSGAGGRRVLPYRATAVRFDGTNDYLTRDADLTGSADGKEVAFSVWVNFKGGDGVSQIILASGAVGSNGFLLIKRTTNKFEMTFRNAAGTNIGEVRSNNTYTTTVNAGWLHVGGGGDLNTPEIEMTITHQESGAQDTGFLSAAPVNATIDLAEGNWGVGARSDGASRMNGDIADVFYSETFSDWVLGDFLDEINKPVSFVEKPGLVKLDERSFDEWHNNNGSGGGFTVNGSLAVGQNSPSD